MKTTTLPLSPAPFLSALLLSALSTLFWACGDGVDEAGGQDTTVTRAPQHLGKSCRSDAECVSGVCLRGQYGTPFCSRPCEDAWQACPVGPDLEAGQLALCVDMSERPNPNTPAFEGDLQRFCAPRCFENRDCRDLDPAWETCDVPTWLGDPLYPQLGNQRVCQSPSFHGKVPVDPGRCDWERTVEGRFSNEANLCRGYCAYMEVCQELTSNAGRACCEWGCYNRMVQDGTVRTAWRDEVRCFLDNHAAFPATGPRNSCTEPPIACGRSPIDPTPAAALDPE